MIKRLIHRSASKLAALTAASPTHPLTGSPTHKPVDAKRLPDSISRDLARILRPQAAYRWLLPQLAAITPQYIEMTLRGAMAGSHVQAWELFDLMEDSWPRLLKNERELKTGVLNLLRSYEPYREEGQAPTPSAKEKCGLVSAAMRSMRPDPCADENALDGTLFDILDAWFKGQTVLEIDWQTISSPQSTVHSPQSASDEEREQAQGARTVNRGLGTRDYVIVPRATYWVHPTCYAWNMEGRLGLRLELTANITPSGPDSGLRTVDRGLPALSPGTWQSTTYQPRPSQVAPFPEDKFLICISKAKSGTALGGALLRPLAWWWCAANFSADWLMNLTQLWGLPFRLANYDPSAPQATIEAICAMLQNMGSNGWAAFPAGTTVDLKEAGKTGESSPQADLLDRADKQCDLLVLGQTLTSDVGRSGAGGGSLALGKVHAGVKEEIITAAAKYVQGVLETQLFPSILRLNYGSDGSDLSDMSDVSEVPSIKLTSEKEEDQVQSATVIATLVQAGAGKIIGLDWLGKKFGIPKPEEDEPTLETPKPAPPKPVSEYVGERVSGIGQGRQSDAGANGNGLAAKSPQSTVHSPQSASVHRRATALDSKTVDSGLGTVD